MADEYPFSHAVVKLGPPLAKHAAHKINRSMIWKSAWGNTSKLLLTFTNFARVSDLPEGCSFVLRPLEYGEVSDCSARQKQLGVQRPCPALLPPRPCLHLLYS